MFTKALKKLVKRGYLSIHPYYYGDDYMLSLLDESRSKCIGGYDATTYIYGFISIDDIADDYNVSPNELTDDDIQWWFDDVVRITITYDYDCSGQMFTKRIHWHINPCGLISYVHVLGMDI